MTDALTVAASLPTGLINRFSNGQFLLCPEGTQSSADGATAFVNYTVLTQSGAVQTAQLTAPEAGQARAVRITQSQASAQRFGIAQTISAIDCQDLRTSLLNARHRARFSPATGRTMFALLSWAGTADASPADPINDWTNANYTPGQFFVSSVTVLNVGYLHTASGTWATAPYIPFQAPTNTNNLIYVVWTEERVAQNQTLDLGLWQLAPGAVPQDFEYRPFGVESANVYPISAAMAPVVSAATIAQGAQNLNTINAYNVKNEIYGAVGNNIADDTAAIQAAIDEAIAAGGGIVFIPQGDYKVTQTLEVSGKNVLIMGAGREANHDIGLHEPTSALIWAGSVGGTIVQFAPVEGASAQRGIGGGLIDVGLVGGLIAADGLSIKGWFGGQFRIWGHNLTGSIMRAGTATTLGENRGCQFNTISIFGRQTSTAGSTLVVDGIVGANFSFNNVVEISSRYNNVSAILMGSSDSNYFGLIRLNSTGGTGHGLEYLGSDTSGLLASRGNYINMISPGAGGVVARGTSSYVNPSHDNIIGWYDTGNAAPLPTIETGASLFYADQNWVSYRQAIAQLSVGASINTATQARDALPNTTVCLYILSGSSDQIRLTDGTNEWGIHTSSGNLRINRIAGTGRVVINNDFEINGNVGFYTTDPVAKQTVTGSRAGNAALASLLTALATSGLITDSSSA